MVDVGKKKHWKNDSPMSDLREMAKRGRPKATSGGESTTFNRGKASSSPTNDKRPKCIRQKGF